MRNHNGKSVGRKRDCDFLVYHPVQNKTMQKQKYEEESSLQTMVRLNCGRPNKHIWDQPRKMLLFALKRGGFIVSEWSYCH
jgi:hypothetical protein